ncbi:MAG: hypothetical protein H7Z43_09790, partial [Clostridia bacterium]|nr:hypothetical protein [Deltaproteobacteria bacterium]
SDIVGAFIFPDFLANGSQANGNRADILWARAPDTNSPADLIVGTLAHEYQHLVSFALRSSLGDPVASREVLWLDEGISHLMEDLTGWGGSTVDAYVAALESWNNVPFAGPIDSVEQRGKAYTLLRYLVDVRAKSIGANDANDDEVLTAARDLIAPLYTQKRAGFTHALFQEARDDDRMRDWLRAVYATNNDEVRVALDAKFLATANSPESNGQLIGFAPNTDYTTARGIVLNIRGVVPEDADAADSISDSIASSGAHYYLVSGGTGTVNLKLTADSASDISVDAVRVE